MINIFSQKNKMNINRFLFFLGNQYLIDDL